jgi:hypothetical protein
LFAEVDSVARVPRFDVIKSANVDDPISRNSDRTVLDRRPTHRHNNARANDHLRAVAAVSDRRQMFRQIV